MKVRHLIVACTLIGSLAGGSLAAYAQAAPGMVAITQSYIVTLRIQSAMPIITPDQADAGMRGEVLVNTGPGTVLPSTFDQGRPVNHFISAQVRRTRATQTVTSELQPQFLILNQATGAMRRVNAVSTYPAGDAVDVHYGANVYLPDGTYTITVLVLNEQASFSDVMITGGGTLPGVSAAAPAPASALVARDGRTLAGEPAATQALFRALWGSQAAAEWVREHNLSLTGGR